MLRKGGPMQKQKFDEIVSYFNKKVSEMEIETKYKMELLGMVTALGYAHEKETHDKRTETHGVYLDTISRQAAIDMVRDVCDAIMSGCESWYDPETEDEVYKDIREVDAILKCNKEVRIALRNMPSAQPEIIHCGDCRHWKNDHLCECLSRYGTFETEIYFYCGFAERREE